jgi:hypothetical protein
LLLFIYEIISGMPQRFFLAIRCSAISHNLRTFKHNQISANYLFPEKTILC